MAALIAAVAILMFCEVGGAGAAITHLPEGSFGHFSTPGSIAVEEEAGDLLVLDTSRESITKIDQDGNEVDFSELGSPVLDGKGAGNCPTISTSCDEAPQNGYWFDSPDAAQVAVDKSGNPVTRGDIYVSDSFGHVLDVFVPVFLRVEGKQFPKVALKLAGEVDLEVIGRIAFKAGRIVLGFPSLPEMPITSLRLRIFGKGRGILVNDRSLCGKTPVGRPDLISQGGEELRLRPTIKAPCHQRRVLGRQGAPGAD